MLMIQPIQPGAVPLRQIDARTLCGDTVSVRIGRSGLSLSYTPIGSALWRDFDPSPRAIDAFDGCLRGSVVLGAYRDERLVGLAAAADGGRGWCEILDLRVDTSCRLRETGRTLLDACRRFAERGGMVGLTMAVSDANPAMCQFAEHCGFRLEGMDRLALAQTPEERVKPMMRRACELYFYLLNEKG
ncbi:MAG: GNAT family N-acetyltransferase [Clostridia bacterium]|nr:GNAT family N-acetyltransferase [Clostridia bacterium]